MRVFMRKDGGTLLIEPLVAVRVVEVPVSVDQVFDRIAAQAVHGIKDTGARSGDAGIDKHFAVGACQDGDVATRSLDDRDIAAQLVELDGRFRRVIANQVHDFAWLGEASAELNQPPLASRPAATAQQIQKPRRDKTWG